MKLHRWSIVLAVALFPLPAPAGGELELRPGLWEVENRMEGAGGQMEAAQAEMQKQLAGMPPEQREMMEAMMARQGVKLSDGGNLQTSARICLTREMIEQNELPVQQGECKTTLQSRTGNTAKMTFACTDPVASGEGEYTIVSPEAYTMKMVVRTSAQGRPETMNMDATGRWLGPDCGAVAPAARGTSPD